MKSPGQFLKPLFALVAAAIFVPGMAFAVNERNNGEWPWTLKLHGWHDREVAEELGGGWFLNVGPTGIRIQITHDHPAYMTVRYVFRDSPAYGKINIGDIIVGANGTRMTTPHTFGRGTRGRATWDGPMVSMANLIEDSQAADGKIEFIVWPSGVEASEKVVTVEVEPIGRFSPTWPYDCPRSDRLMIELADFLMDEYQRAGRFESRTHTHSSAVLALMAANQPKYDRLVKEILSDYGSKRYDPTHGAGFPAWNWGHDAIVMGEYYLLTKDRSLLPAIASLIECVAAAQDAEADSYSHKPFPYIRRRMAAGGPKGYGGMSMTSGFIMVGLSLFKEAGLDYGAETHERLYQAFLRSASPSGAIGYGFEGRDHAVISLTGATAEKVKSPQGIGFRIPGDMENIQDYTITWPTPADPRYRPTDWVEEERDTNKVYDQGDTLLVVRHTVHPEPTRPYDHNGQMVDHHGRSGLGALAHSIGSGDRKAFGYLSDLMATGAAKSGKALMDGHASTHMHVLWGSLGAALADEQDFRQYMEDVKWWFIMAHTHNGGYVVMPGRDYASTDHVYGTRVFPTAAAALVLALKERRLQITGAARSHGPAETAGLASTGPRQPRTLAADKIALIDQSLLAALSELGRNSQLEPLPMQLSKATARVWLAGVASDQTLTFKAAEGEAEASFKFDELNTEDKAWLARLVARQRPSDREAQGRAGIYLELSGDTRVADQYYDRAGEQFKALVAEEFD